jgi:hypothetical protein
VIFIFLANFSGVIKLKAFPGMKLQFVTLRLREIDFSKFCIHAYAIHQPTYFAMNMKDVRAYRLCGLVAEFLATDPKFRVLFPALPDFLRGSESGTWSTQLCEYN